VTTEARLGEIVTALEAVGVRCLVMGGHAVRFYGVDRNTNDFDLHLSPDSWDDLPARLRGSALFAGREPPEGPSWRPLTFRRFQVGTLPDGREEWLEFWKENHLLPPFAALHARREVGAYGGRTLSFLSLPDLIRSKETERETDWQDVALLEEFLDARVLARASTGSVEWPVALSQLRSRRGFESCLLAGHLRDETVVGQAMALTTHPVPQAILLPSVPSIPQLPAVSAPIEPVVVNRLRTVPPGAPLHLALVEAVRRHYKQLAQAAEAVTGHSSAFRRPGGPRHATSPKPARRARRSGWRSFSRARASTWRTRSRVTPNCSATSSSVRARPSRRP
jgi:hypothetical protein